MLHAKPIARTMRSTLTAGRSYMACRRGCERGTVPAMEAREEPRDPGYDDWFDEPELPTETQSGANRDAYEDVEEVWTLPEDEDAGSPGQRESVIAARAFTTTQVAIIGLSLLPVILALLAAVGGSHGSTGSVPPPSTPK